VVAQVEELRHSFWRGRAVEVLVASRDRALPPEKTCPGCDWGFFDVSAAREAKRALFLESMQRIGKIPPGSFGEIPIAASPLAYRIRNRFHLSGRGDELLLGQFAPRTNRVESISGCRAITGATAEILAPVRDAIAGTGASVSELATLEDPAGGKHLARATLSDGPKRHLRSDSERIAGALVPLFAGVRVVDVEGKLLREAGESRLDIRAGDRTFVVSVDSFFQSNRHLADSLLRDVGEASRGLRAEALDAFGGVGFFAAALLAAGHGVVSVEGSTSAARDAALTRLTWPDADRWKIVPSSVAGFLSASPARFDLVVADPPRAGLTGIAGALAGRARERFVYVSCDPATLARDLPEIVASGFEITGARLYDLFPLTHRVEAVVTLVRVARKTV
jgi:23S rRNA (uracil1939-C5)-methyltransferase